MCVCVCVIQVSSLLEKQLVEEAVLLAETIAAVEGSRDQTAADEVGLPVREPASTSPPCCPAVHV